VRVIIPFAPGGSTDATTRPVLERLQQTFGQPFIIDNRGGAGSVIGSLMVQSSAPDGYTLLATTASFVTAPSITPNAHEVAAFDPIAMLTQSPFAIFVRKDSPIHTLADLIRVAREMGDRFFYATAGAGSSTHFGSEYFNLRAGLRIQHVPYRGIGPAMIGLLSGDVQMIITTPSSGAGQLRDGLIRVVAYTSGGRPPGLPDAPTVRETGLDYETTSWWAMLGPRGVPMDIRRLLNETINGILREPPIARIMEMQGSTPSPMSLNAFADLLRRETAQWAEVARVANIRAE
jgi:tripartite-type tricarboxylate transporter receptor subunit TctC